MLGVEISLGSLRILANPKIMSVYMFILLHFSLTLKQFQFYLKSSILLSFGMQRSYVVYPPEAPRPPSPEELREMARELARKRNER